MSKFRENLYAVGASLSLSGVTLGMYVNQLLSTGGGVGSPLLMFMSFVLLTNWKRLVSMKSNVFHTPLIWLIVFQCVMILYGVMSNEGNMTSQYLSFHLYIIAICLAYGSHTSYDFIYKIPRALFYLSLIAAFLGAYFCSLGMVSGEDAYTLRNQDDNYVLEMFTVANGALLNWFSGLTFNKKNILEKILFAVALALDLYIVVTCTKRTPMVVMIAGTALYLYKNGLLTRAVFFKQAKYVLLAIVAIVYAYNSFPSFQEGIDSLFTRLYDGVGVLVGAEGTQHIEDSAQSRVALRELAYQYVTTQFGFFNFIFGYGYLTAWLDAPLIEAYLDMGIIGFIAYFYFVIKVPITCMLKRNISKVGLMAIMFSLYTLMSAFNSGNPYAYIKYTGACMLLFLFYTKKKDGSVIALDNK